MPEGEREDAGGEEAMTKPRRVPAKVRAVLTPAGYALLTRRKSRCIINARISNGKIGSDQNKSCNRRGQS